MPPPKIDLPEELIEQIVREHFERKSKGGVKAHVKKHGVGYAKLVVAITALTAAINGYVELSKDNVKLSQENRMLFRVLASKVNSMAERLAYLEGRTAGMGPERAAKEVEEKLTPFSRPHPFMGHRAGAGRIARHEAISDEAEATDDKSIVSAEPGPFPKPLSSVQAYEQLPEDLGELIELEQQALEP